MSKILDEGVVKFKYTLKRGNPPEEKEYLELEKWRALFHKMNLIGEYTTEKIGYGNISKRTRPNNLDFVISGTQTGRFPHLQANQYTKVTKCNLIKMNVEALGLIPHSSESLTHYAIYLNSHQINYIFHIHNTQLWNYMIKEKMSATDESIAYGTSEMAKESQGLIGESTQGIFVMKGHQDGIIAYGKTADEAGKIILDTLKKMRNESIF